MYVLRIFTHYQVFMVNMHIMDEKATREIVNSEIKKFVSDSLDKEMRRVLHDSNSKTRDEMIQSFKNAMEAVMKTLWSKRDFWKNDIK